MNSTTSPPQPLLPRVCRRALFAKRSLLTSMQTLAENVRGGEIDRCGHWISEEQPKYLVEQLLAFFGEER